MVSLIKLWKSFVILVTQEAGGATGGVGGSFITSIRGEWSKFRKLVPLLVSSGFPLEQKADYILHVYVTLSYMKVELDQLKRKVWSD